MTRGSLGLDELNISACEDAFDIIPKITLIPDESMEDRKAGIRGAKMQISTTNGDYEETVLIPKGEAKKPLGWNDVCKKFSQCVGDLYDLQTQNDAIEDIREIEPSKPFAIPFV